MICRISPATRPLEMPSDQHLYCLLASPTITQQDRRRLQTLCRMDASQIHDLQQTLLESRQDARTNLTMRDLDFVRSRQLGRSRDSIDVDDPWEMYMQWRLSALDAKVWIRKMDLYQTDNVQSQDINPFLRSMIPMEPFIADKLDLIPKRMVSCNRILRMEINQSPDWSRLHTLVLHSMLIRDPEFVTSVLAHLPKLVLSHCQVMVSLQCIKVKKLVLYCCHMDTSCSILPDAAEIVLHKTPNAVLSHHNDVYVHRASEHQWRHLMLLRAKLHLDSCVSIPMVTQCTHLIVSNKEDKPVHISMAPYLRSLTIQRASCINVEFCTLHELYLYEAHLDSYDMNRFPCLRIFECRQSSPLPSPVTFVNHPHIRHVSLDIQGSVRMIRNKSLQSIHCTQMCRFESLRYHPRLRRIRYVLKLVVHHPLERHIHVQKVPYRNLFPIIHQDYSDVRRLCFTRPNKTLHVI